MRDGKPGRKELIHPLEHFLNRCCVAEKSDRHLQPLGWNFADTSLAVVRDPLDEV